MASTVSQDNLLEIDSGLFVRSTSQSSSCVVCNNVTYYSAFYCPESYAVKYWRIYFEVLNRERSIHLDSTTLIICSKDCWLKLIEPLKSTILIQICDKT